MLENVSKSHKKRPKKFWEEASAEREKNCQKRKKVG
jgi:hypothetical protein